MEFNRLLSQAISFYGEPEGKIVQQNTKSISKKIDVAKYKTINKITDLDKLIKNLKDIKPDDIDEMEFIHLLNEMPAAYMLYIIHKLMCENCQ